MGGFLSWVIKLIGGFLPIGTKPFPEWLGKILWVVGMIVIVLFALGIISPGSKTSTTIQQGGTQIVYQEQRDMMGIGCNMFRAYIRAGVKGK